MAATTPRISSLYIDEDDEGYFDGYLGAADRRTPLDKTIDKIGMGSYQWLLLSLCGFGWLADNMWLQAVAIILPRVQRQYSVSDDRIGILSASVFAGMMIGAVIWGTCSDLLGRVAAFNGTLILTSIFGVLASISQTFFYLCTSLFFLGSAVGGSMPTDGTLLLEHMPQGKQYLVTALSVFFSFGAVLSALVAIVVVPGNSCTGSSPCNIETDNKGWQYLLQILAAITLIMFLSRITFFRLHESPRYLVHAGRPQEAIVSLQKISEFNGEEMTLDLDDVLDKNDRPPMSNCDSDNDRLTKPTSSPEDLEPPDSHRLSVAAERQADYQSVRMSPSIEEQREAAEEEHPEVHFRIPEPTTLPRRGLTSRKNSVSSMKSVYTSPSFLPRWIRRPFDAWIDRLSLVLQADWRRTTILVWSMWWSMSFAYTMFNVYLPKMLEARTSTTKEVDRGLERTMWDIVVFTLGGCPGALLGAYLQELTLGKRISLAISTLVTGFFCWIFLLVESEWTVRATTVGISLSATTMWAILYGWTPAIFPTSVRGTACGSASALSRVGGVMAPIFGGWLLVIDPAFPVYASIVVFAFSCICVLLLPEENQCTDQDNFDGGLHH